jgi:hypothetical protein
LDWKKNCRGPFSPRPAQLDADPTHLRARVGLPAVTTSPSLTDGARLSDSSSPKYSPAPRCVSSPANSRRRAGHPSSACNTSLSTCRRESSCRLRCAVASHRRCPLLCCHPSMLQPRCPRQELDNEVSRRLPHATPSHPLTAGR